MKLLIFIVSLLMLFSTICVANENSDYLGIQDTEKKECTHIGSGLFNEVKGQRRLGYELTNCNGKEMLWLSETVGYKGKKPIENVLQVIPIEDSKKGELLPPFLCDLQSDEQQEVIGIGHFIKDKDGSYFAKIHIAWRLDNKKRILEAIPSESIKCTLEPPE